MSLFVAQRYLCICRVPTIECKEWERMRLGSSLELRRKWSKIISKYTSNYKKLILFCSYHNNGYSSPSSRLANKFRCYDVMIDICSSSCQWRFWVGEFHCEHLSVWMKAFWRTNTTQFPLFIYYALVSFCAYNVTIMMSTRTFVDLLSLGNFVVKIKMFHVKLSNSQKRFELRSVFLWGRDSIGQRTIRRLHYRHCYVSNPYRCFSLYNNAGLLSIELQLFQNNW